MDTTDSLKILIADDDGVNSRHLAEFLTTRGFQIRIVTKLSAAREIIDQWQPRFVLADLMLPEGGALPLIDHVRFTAKGVRRRSVGVIVMSGHSSEGNVREVIQRGARDYLVKPFTPEDVWRRLVFHVRGHRRPEDALQKIQPSLDDAGLMLQLTDLIMQQALRDTDLEEILYNLTRMVNLRTDGARCSIISCLDQKTGVVVTSNDDRDAYGIRVDLYKYPEVVHVMNTQNSIAVDDLADAAELRGVRDLVRDISFNSLIVCPVSRHDRPFGVLSLRLPEGRVRITDHEIRFVEIVARVVSLVLNGRRHQTTRDFWDRSDPRGMLQFPVRQVKNS